MSRMSLKSTAIMLLISGVIDVWLLQALAQGRESAGLAKDASGSSPSTNAQARTQALPAAVQPETAKEMSLDLGAGVKMSFVWIQALQTWVGKYEVTNGEYRRYKPDHRSKDFGGKSLNGDNQPVVNVNFYDAKDFAAWVNSNVKLPEGYKARLPSESEWLAYAKCGDSRTYPWGNDWPPAFGNFSGQESAWFERIGGYNDGYAVTCPVDKSGRNSWGLYGVGGNVCELTASDSAGSSCGAWRGGSWDSDAKDILRCDFRRGIHDSLRDCYLGFRVVLSR